MFKMAVVGVLLVLGLAVAASASPVTFAVVNESSALFAVNNAFDGNTSGGSSWLADSRIGSAATQGGWAAPANGGTGTDNQPGILLGVSGLAAGYTNYASGNVVSLNTLTLWANTSASWAPKAVDIQVSTNPNSYLMQGSTNASGGTALGLGTQPFGTWTDLGTFNISQVNNQALDTINLGGVQASYLLITFVTDPTGTAYGPTYNDHNNFAGFQEIQADMSAAPEPATMGLLGLGLVGLIARRRSAK